MRLRVVGARVRIEWMMFASSTSCQMRRDLLTGSDGCSTERDGGATKSGGDSGGGGSSEGNSSLNGAPEAKLEAVVSGEIPENPHIAINSSRGSVVGIGVFKLPPGKPKTAGSIVGSNVESCELEVVSGAKNERFGFSRLARSELKSKQNPGLTGG
ncbi:hypothetical protein B0H10DRAFT_1951217 [Mycena sp. CBHHK59/15]|nr:hypothetical protein B0H10DRAFT_1951217 [Mycena sp. CBHHK59/15]